MSFVSHMSSYRQTVEPHGERLKFDYDEASDYEPHKQLSCCKRERLDSCLTDRQVYVGYLAI